MEEFRSIHHRYDPPDPETRNVFNGFKYYVTTHDIAQILQPQPPSFLRRLEEPLLPFRIITHFTKTRPCLSSSALPMPASQASLPQESGSRISATTATNDFRLHSLSFSFSPAAVAVAVAVAPPASTSSLPLPLPLPLQTNTDENSRDRNRERYTTTSRERGSSDGTRGSRRRSRETRDRSHSRSGDDDRYSYYNSTDRQLTPPPLRRNTKANGRARARPQEEPPAYRNSPPLNTDCDGEMSSDDILEFYLPENNTEFKEMYRHPHKAVERHVGAGDAELVRASATYKDKLEMEEVVANNLKQCRYLLISAVNETKKLKDRQLCCTQQLQRLHHQLVTLKTVDQSWIDIPTKEVGLIIAVSDKLKLMQTANAFNEIDNLNSELNQLNRQLQQVREKSRQMNTQLTEFKDAQKSIANKLIETITLSNSTENNLKCEEEILKIRMEQHNGIIEELKSARLETEAAKKNLYDIITPLK